jgi:hypothetical protein
MVFVSFHWNAKRIKSAQPKILLVILLGSLLGMLKVFCVAADVSVGSCIAQTWLQHIAYRLIFRTLSLKLWRVHKVVNASNFKRIVITENTVLTYVAVDVLLIVIILAILTGLEVNSGHVVDYKASYSRNQRISEPFCTANAQNPGVLVVNSILFIFEGFYLFAAVWYTFLTRSVPPSINESKSIAPGLILVIVGIVVITAVLFSMQLTPNDQIIIENVAFLVMISFSNANYFGSKFWDEYKHIIFASASVAPRELSGKENVSKALYILNGKVVAEKEQQQREKEKEEGVESGEKSGDAEVLKSIEVDRLVQALRAEKTIEGRMNLCRRRISNWKEMLILLSDENFKTSVTSNASAFESGEGGAGV